jgi:alpha-tubulin suppressor-like RCC1 family protein
LGECVVQPPDVDSDGEPPLSCGGADCDDSDPNVGPHAVELCGNLVDEDCSGAADDLDCDGVISTVGGGLDCDDDDASVNPHQRERCNGIDDDCNGLLDGLDEDDDGDGRADACALALARDCDDEDPTTHFDAPEVCDRIDNDCVHQGELRYSGGSREEPKEDFDEDGHAPSGAHCLEIDDEGTLYFPRDDCDDGDPAVFPGAPEICDGLDNDCDGVPDDADGRDEPGSVCLPASVSVGYSHSCATRADGATICWGHNLNGELGVPPSSEPCDAVVVPGLEGVVQVGASQGYLGYSCALHEDGTVTCWGREGYVRPGCGEGDVFEKVQGLEEVSQVSLGRRHSCAIVGGGEVLCWGEWAGYVIDGQSTFEECSVGPTLVPDIHDATWIGVGISTSCAVRETGHVTCWGSSDWGALGDGTFGDWVNPESGRSIVSDIDDALQVGCGDEFCCALRAEGGVSCWGAGGLGQLGSGEGTLDSCELPYPPRMQPCATTPVAVVGIESAEELAVGGSHACARLESGQVLCWGDNSLWQLGLDLGVRNAFVPVEVPGIEDALGLSAGWDTTCVLYADGLECFGSNERTLLGRGCGMPGMSSLPAPVSFLASPAQTRDRCFLMASLGVRCASRGEPPRWIGDFGRVVDVANISTTDEDLGEVPRCIVLDTGEVRCFGEGSHGQLGTGGLPSRSTVAGLADARSVVCGEAHCCALRRTGRVACWGEDQDGQLGAEGSGVVLCDGWPCAPAPLPVESVRDARQIAAGRAHTCALGGDGSVACWGNNDEGQVGVAGVRNASAPVSVSRLPEADPAVQITAAPLGDATCALLQSGAVRCWGRASDGTSGGGPDPRPVLGLGIPADIAVTDLSVCARLPSGHVRCSGAQGFDVSRLADARDLDCGPAHCCATRTSGQTLCWGELPAGMTYPYDAPMTTLEPVPVAELLAD